MRAATCVLHDVLLHAYTSGMVSRMGIIVDPVCRTTAKALGTLILGDNCRCGHSPFLHGDDGCGVCIVMAAAPPGSVAGEQPPEYVRITAQKLASVVPVSRELLEPPLPLTPEERAQLAAEARERIDTRLAAVASVIDGNDALRRIAELHRPSGPNVPHPRCEGCEDVWWEHCPTIDAMLGL